MSIHADAVRAVITDRLAQHTGAHPTVVHDVVHTGRLQAVLAEDAHHDGTHTIGRDYAAEADRLAPVVLLAMLQPPSEAEIARAADIAALHGGNAA